MLFENGTQDSLEERMQRANKGLWRDVEIHRSKDAPWTAKCRKTVEQVCSVSCFGSESWAWSRAILDRIQGWEKKAMRRLFGFRSKEDETLTGYCTRTAIAARTIWKNETPFLSEAIAESMRRRGGWACDTRQKCGVKNIDVRAVDQWALRDGARVPGEHWTCTKNIAFVVEDNNAYPAAEIDDYVKHIFSEPTTWRTWAQKGRERSRLRKETLKNTGRRFEVFGVGSTKTDGRSGCGVVMKGVDKDQWITIRKIAVPL